MGGVVALITSFERHGARQLALQDEVPFVHQRIPEVRLDAAQRRHAAFSVNGLAG